MASGYAVQRTIQASPERVWALLAEPAAYPDWNPAVASLQGRIADGETIKLRSSVNPKRMFSLKVSDVQPGRGMVWADGMPLGLFKGVRTFTLRAAGERETEFSMQELYSGPLAALITRAIPDLSESFVQFADGLKAAAEGS